MIGYFGLSVLILFVFACWLAVQRKFANRFPTGVARWSVILEEQGDE
jgi:hypothetical protein